MELLDVLHSINFIGYCVLLPQAIRFSLDLLADSSLILQVDLRLELLDVLHPINSIVFCLLLHQAIRVSLNFLASESGRIHS
jgi:hypothetical protein